MARVNLLHDKLQLDWEEYYRNFVELHGEPVQHEGRFLFRDGWQYALVDYQGPEYSPPEDRKELKRLKVAYWKLLCDRLKKEVDASANQIDSLVEWQKAKSMPLQQRVSQKSTTESGLPILKRGKPEDLNLTGLRAKLDDQRYFLKEAQEALIHSF